MNFYRIIKQRFSKKQPSMLSPEQKKILTGIIKKPHVNGSCIGCSACTAIS